jgi:hypothetical protein
MPPRFPRPCTKCGALNKTGGRLCLDCQATASQLKEQDETRRAKKQFLYGGDYKSKAQTVRANAKLCYLCGEGGRVDDPWQADHVDPTLGHLSPLLPAHASCNRTKSNKPFQP